MPADSRRASRVPDSIHLIPIPGADVRRPPRYEPYTLYAASLLAVLAFTLLSGIALEVALAISTKHNGFSVPERNVFSFASVQTLTSFFPTLLVIPLAYMWRQMDWMVKWYHPYIVLSRGNAAAEESLLLDYVAVGTIHTVYYAIKYRHKLVFISALTATVAYLFQPLAGSVFSVQQLPESRNTSVTSIRSIGLAQGIESLDAFVAAAGYVSAAVFHTLPDPPFIHDGWATSEFVLPSDPVLNGSVVVHTNGIQSSANCGNPAFPPVVTPTAGNASTGSYTISAQSVSGCGQTITLNSSETAQFGVINTPCGASAGVNVTFQPVMFYYFHLRADNGKAEAQTVFCAPTVAAYRVLAYANLTTSSIASVTILDNYTTANNVTGAPLSGQAFNGLIFPKSNDSFVEARALSTVSGVPGAIFRFATQQPNGPQASFDDPKGFLGITHQVYTQHLAIIAKSIYFVSANSTLGAELTSLKPRLLIEPLAAHALAIIFILLALAGAAIHIAHRRARRALHLAAAPGSIAASLALTAHSGFGARLRPYDDERAMRAALRGLRFGLDPRTGAIVAEEGEEMLLGELGRDEERDGGKKGTLSRASSTETARPPEGYPPWGENKSVFDTTP